MYFANTFLISLAFVPKTKKKSMCLFFPWLPNGNRVGRPRVLGKHRGIYFPGKAPSGLPFPGPSCPCSQMRPQRFSDLIRNHFSTQALAQRNKILALEGRGEVE
jgi:hypothetical protein